MLPCSVLLHVIRVSLPPSFLAVLAEGAVERGNGVALRALRLMGAYLKSIGGTRQMILRMSCENAASLRVAEKSESPFLGILKSRGPE